MLFHFVNAEVQLSGAENINTGTDIAAEGQASFVQCLPTCYFSPLNASGYFREESGYWVELQGKKNPAPRMEPACFPGSGGALCAVPAVRQQVRLK